MRGEHTVGGRYRVRAAGSSPRARGTRVILGQGGLQAGIIPACAGNTRWSLSLSRAVRDHPRVRGEHYGVVSDLHHLAGSSPRARGTHDCKRGTQQQHGIIPACAGNTWWSAVAVAALRDHPRVRGEHFIFLLGSGVLVGSSPRARGTPVSSNLIMGSAGIIPACAGNTTESQSARLCNWDHPRVRGEHAIEKPTAKDRMGSSPRARGTLIVAGVRFRWVGIIPACAGNTHFDTTHSIVWRDHPRVRGEHMQVNAASIAAQGSSPRARGTQAAYPVASASRRIIPACAGNTMNPPQYSLYCWDHPRVRGEHTVFPWDVSADRGSSPRARGTPTHTWP